MTKEKLIEQLKKTFFYKWYRKKFYQTNIKDYKNQLLDNIETNDFIKKLLLKEEPCMITRFGSNELSFMKSYLKKQDYSNKQKYVALNNTGIFPIDNEILDSVAKLYLESTKNIDLLGIWFNPFEDKISNDYCPNAKITKLRDLEPYFSNNPWSYYLKDKKVLVIHPFTQSIEKQYLKKKLLFKNQNILPEFTLITYPAIQSLGGNDEYKSWFHAVDKMKEDVSKIDFDVAIIGAGAYGLPLASYVKDIGKKAIHLGGATQMLFGVYGQRWAIHPDFQNIINEHWAKPTPNEKPKNATKVENACYW